MNKVDILKEEMNESLKTVYENTNNQWKQMNKHSLRHKSKNRNSKKIQPEENQEMKNLET